MGLGKQQFKCAAGKVVHERERCSGIVHPTFTKNDIPVRDNRPHRSLRHFLSSALYALVDMIEML